jgi:hypothetical protein
MAVVVNSSWKIPCGYFLVNGLTGEKANLTKECITKLHEVGVKVVSFMCNGPTSHQSMLKLIGAQLLPCKCTSNIHVTRKPRSIFS